MKGYAAYLGLGFALIAGAASAAPLPAEEFTGRGTQIYRCGTAGRAPAWQLLGPDAQMYDAAGKVAARHFYGPTWQANDGSEIKGSVLVANPSPAGPLARAACDPRSTSGIVRAGDDCHTHRH
jgi:hypothetical protein